MRYRKTAPAVYRVGPKFPCPQQYEKALDAVLRQCIADCNSYAYYYGHLAHLKSLKLKQDHELELLWTQPRL